MNRDEYLRRKAAGLPIESADELTFALMEIQKRVPERTPLWYLANRLIWAVIDYERDEERRLATPARGAMP